MKENTCLDYFVSYLCQNFILYCNLYPVFLARQQAGSERKVSARPEAARPPKGIKPYTILLAFLKVTFSFLIDGQQDEHKKDHVWICGTGGIRPLLEPQPERTPVECQ